MTSRQRKRVKRYRAEPRVRGEYRETVYATGGVVPTSPSFGSAIALLDACAPRPLSVFLPGMPGAMRIRWSLEDER